MSNTSNKQRAPAIRAAIVRQTPERGYEQRIRREPMTDAQLKAWSDEQAEKYGVHTKAKEAAQRGRTLMVFVQALSESVPYEEYAAMLESGFRATGHPDPKKRAGDELYRTEAARAREAEVAEAAGPLAVDPARLNAASLYGLHGEELDEFLDGAEVPEMPSPTGLGGDDITAAGQSEAQLA